MREWFIGNDTCQPRRSDAGQKSPVSKEKHTTMYRLFAFISETISHRGARGAARPDVMNWWPVSDRDPWGSYVSVLQEARQRRGELFTRL